MFWEPVLKSIPTAVMFGVFLYLGVSALSGVQMYKRIKLLLIPVKYHPSRGFVRRVSTKENNNKENHMADVKLRQNGICKNVAFLILADD